MAYPANLSFKHQESSSRLWSLLTLLGIKSIVMIPHIIVMGVLQMVAGILSIIGIFAVLFLGRYPQGIEKIVVGVNQWNFRVNAYFLCMTDKYPPFNMESGGEYPADLTFEHQESSSRLWALLTLLGIKGIALIPHMIIVFLMMIGAMFVMIIGIFAVLFTGKYPQSFENYMVTLYKYLWRIQAYYMCLTDQYPPISWKEYFETNKI